MAVPRPRRKRSIAVVGGSQYIVCDGLDGGEVLLLFGRGGRVLRYSTGSYAKVFDLSRRNIENIECDDINEKICRCTKDLLNDETSGEIARLYTRVAISRS